MLKATIDIVNPVATGRTMPVGVELSVAAVLTHAFQHVI